MHLADICGFLLPGGVYERFNLIALARILGVCNYTDNLYITFAVVESDAFAKNLFIRKELPLERLINDGYRWRMAVIPFRELAPTQKVNLHRRKIVLTNHLSHCVVLGRGRCRFAR